MVFPVDGMRKKKCVKKKKGAKCKRAGLLHISFLCESRYSGLYHDTGCAWPGRLSHDTAGLGHDTVLAAATIRPRVGTTWSAACAHGLAVGVRSRYKALYRDITAGACSWLGVCHDTLGCIVTGGG